MTELCQKNFSLVTELYRLCEEKGLTVATAESCTGGSIGAFLTHPAGASKYYLGGIISYANSVKENALGVKAKTLAAVGAVSRETCEEMARGAIHAIKTSLSVAVTGLAGPGGETPLKPQGLVYVGVCDGNTVTVRKNLFKGDRTAVRLQTVQQALTMLIEAAKAYS